MKTSLFSTITALLFACSCVCHADVLDWTSGEKIVIPLQRGPFTVLRYPAKLPPGRTSPKVLVVFGSGCGGWSYWEENVCHKLQADGDEVLGIDFSLYAQMDYDLAILESDYRTIVQKGLTTYAAAQSPVILGGWSTGAEQAVAAAGGPQPPPGLVGLLLVSPGSEGGYGSYAVSYLDLDAPSTKLFKLTDFAPKLSGLQIVQWHAEFDPLDSISWLHLLKTPHREYTFPDAIHDYDGACASFLTGLSSSTSWILDKKSNPPSSMGITISQIR